jgi:hypothetical protein
MWSLIVLSTALSRPNTLVLWHAITAWLFLVRLAFQALNNCAQRHDLEMAKSFALLAFA